MIIVKNKGKQNPIFIPRNTITDPVSNNNNGGEISSITEEYVDGRIEEVKEYVDEQVNTKQNTLVSGQNIKTINGESILGSGNITIEGGSGGGEIPEGVKPTYYLWKETSSYGNSSMLNNNKNVRNILLTYAYSEEYPIVILKDYYNDTISNNFYIKDNYIEIQCCNSRVGGKNSDLIDERYELTVDGWLKEVKKETVASQNWVNEKLGDIETVLDNIIGDSNGGGDNGSSIFPL